MWIETSRSDNNITKSNNQTQDALAAEMGTTIEEDEDELVDKQTLSNVNLAGMASQRSRTTGHVSGAGEVDGLCQVPSFTNFPLQPMLIGQVATSSTGQNSVGNGRDYISGHDAVMIGPDPTQIITKPVTP